MIYKVKTDDSLFMHALKIQMKFDTLCYWTDPMFSKCIFIRTTEGVDLNCEYYTPNEYFKAYYSDRGALNLEITNELVISNDTDNIKFAINIICTSNLYEYCNYHKTINMNLKYYLFDPKMTPSAMDLASVKNLMEIIEFYKCTK